MAASSDRFMCLSYRSFMYDRLPLNLERMICTKILVPFSNQINFVSCQHKRAHDFAIPKFQTTIIRVKKKTIL